MFTACATLIIINMTQLPILYPILDSSKKTCKVRYKSCLEKLIKKDETTYEAICKGDK